MTNILFMKALLLITVLFVGQNCFLPIFIPYNNKKRALFEEKTLQGKGKDKILVIPITGLITSVEQKKLFQGQEDSTISFVKNQLSYASNDSSIKAVILRINSPGGTVTASDIIYKEILNFKQQKGIPVVALFLDTAASGAYYIAMASDYVTAHPTSITGSIGVIFNRLNFKEGLERIGIEDDSVKSGKNKMMGSPVTDMSIEQWDLMLEVINSLYNKFYQAVKLNRKNVPEQRLKILCDGRIFAAETALKEGMIDEIGYIDDIIKKTVSLPNYKKSDSDNPKIIMYHKPGQDIQNLYQTTGSTSNNSSILEKLTDSGANSNFLYLWSN